MNIVENQRNFFNSNATKPIVCRKSQLQKLYSVLKENEKLLNDAVYTDFQKSEFDTFTTELAFVYHDIEEALKKLHGWSAPKRVRTNLANFPARSYIIPEPLGIVLVIGAWNYPYMLSFAPAVAALTAGNTVILKPSELPVNTSHAMAQIINSNFDPSYFNVVEGGIPETTTLLDNKFDKIFFTGSAVVGRIVYEAAAKNLTPVTLELGGKSPAIITENCNLEISVKRLVWAKFLNAGQTCIAPDYVFVHESVKDRFLELVLKEIKKSEFSLSNGNYVQIINRKNAERLVKLIDGHGVYFGGKYKIEERFLEPTILTDITFDDTVMQEEIFGPILPVLTYDNLDTAIAEIKKRPKPLSCYVFTKDKTTKHKILNELSFGGGAVNDAVMHIANNNLPFGGVGQSGFGAYHGEEGFKNFSHYKSIIDKPTWFEPTLKYFPHTMLKFKLIKQIMHL